MTLLLFLIIISILVFVHELGHFLVAKWAGIKVEEFGLGFPPKIFSKKIGETIYSINALPIGGFVRLYGEDKSVDKEKSRAFYYKSKEARAAVTVAGVVMNFLLAVLVFSALSWTTGVPEQTGRVKVEAVVPGTPADQAGLRESDVILGADGQTFKRTEEFTDFVNRNKGQEIALDVSKRGTDMTEKLVIVPRTDPPEGEGSLGVVVSSKKLVDPPLWQKPVLSLWQGTQETWFWAKTTVLGVGGAIVQAIQGKAPDGIAGPVGIFQITGGVCSIGPFNCLTFLAILSVNLGVLNIAPFPALDGGRLLFIIVEAIFGRRVLPTFERYAHVVGLIVLLFLIALVTYRDILRLISGVPLV